MSLWAWGTIYLQNYNFLARDVVYEWWESSRGHLLYLELTQMTQSSRFLHSSFHWEASNQSGKVIWQVTAQCGVSLSHYGCRVHIKFIFSFLVCLYACVWLWNLDPLIWHLHDRFIWWGHGRVRQNNVMCQAQNTCTGHCQFSPFSFCKAIID